MKAERIKRRKAEEGEQVVGEAWNAVAAATVQQQAPGWTRSKHKDIRTQRSNTIVRFGLASCSAAGAQSVAHLTTQSPKTLKNNASILAAVVQDFINTEIDNAIQEIAKSQKLPIRLAEMLVVCDETELEAYLTKEVAATFARAETHPRGPSVVGSFVQVVHLHVAGTAETTPFSIAIIVPPYVMENPTASNLVSCILDPAVLDKLKGIARDAPLEL